MNMNRMNHWGLLLILLTVALLQSFCRAAEKTEHQAITGAYALIYGDGEADMLHRFDNNTEEFQRYLDYSMKHPTEKHTIAGRVVFLSDQLTTAANGLKTSGTIKLLDEDGKVLASTSEPFDATITELADNGNFIVPLEYYFTDQPSTTYVKAETLAYNITLTDPDKGINVRFSGSTDLQPPASVTDFSSSTSDTDYGDYEIDLTGLFITLMITLAIYLLIMAKSMGNTPDAVKENGNPEAFHILSGEYTLAGVIGTFLCTGLIAIIAGVLYALLTHYIPLVGITNFFLAFGFSFLIGISLLFIAQKFQIRNASVVTVLGFLCVCIGLYTAWATYTTALAEWEYYIIHPADLGRTIALINIDGVWEVKSLRPTGIFLWGLWILEACLLYGIVALTLSGYKENVFCEECNKWLEESDSFLFKTLDNDLVKQSLLRGDAEFIEAIVPAHMGLGRFLEFKISSCKGCDKKALKLNELTVSLDNNGKESKQERTLLSNLRIDNIFVEAMKARQEMVIEEPAEDTDAAGETDDAASETETQTDNTSESDDDAFGKF